MRIYENTLTVIGVSIQSGEYGMRAYANSIRGRAQLESEVPTETVAEVYSVWGSAPRVAEPEPQPTPAPQPTSQEKFNASVMVQIARLKAGAK